MTEHPPTSNNPPDPTAREALIFATGYSDGLRHAAQELQALSVRASQRVAELRGPSR